MPLEALAAVNLTATQELYCHAAKAGVTPKRYFKEVRLNKATDLTPGAEGKGGIFEVGGRKRGPTFWDFC